MKTTIKLYHKIGDIVWYSSDHYIAKATIVGREVVYKERKDEHTIIEVQYLFRYGNTTHRANGDRFYETKEEAFEATAKNIRIEE